MRIDRVWSVVLDNRTVEDIHYKKHPHGWRLFLGENYLALLIRHKRHDWWVATTNRGWNVRGFGSRDAATEHVLNVMEIGPYGYVTDEDRKLDAMRAERMGRYIDEHNAEVGDYVI